MVTVYKISNTDVCLTVRYLFVGKVHLRLYIIYLDFNVFKGWVYWFCFKYYDKSKPCILCNKYEINGTQRNGIENVKKGMWTIVSNYKTNLFRPM